MTQISQNRLAQRLGISPGLCSRYIQRGMPRDPEGAAAWRAQNVAPYTRPGNGNPAEQQPAATGGLNLPGERARLAAAQASYWENKNAVQRGEYAPIVLLAEVLAAASAAVAERLDGLPARLRMACPDLPTEARDVISATVAAARNEWVRATADLAMAGLEQDGAAADAPAI